MTGPVLRLRRQATARGERLMMPATLQVRRATGHTTSTVNGLVIPSYAIIRPPTRGRIKTVSAMSRPTDIAGQAIELQRRGTIAELPLAGALCLAEDLLDYIDGPQTAYIGQSWPVELVVVDDNARCLRLHVIIAQ
jgi:hypothetical protein